MTENELIVIDNSVRLGSITVATPQDVIDQASKIAKQLANIIKDRKLYSTISGKNFVRVEGWTTMGAMLGILPREVAVTETENGDFLADVELIRASDGMIVGRASAIVGSDEKTWAGRPRYARRSMSVTRATGKAYRLGWSWIITLAGFEPTPAEEMDGVVDAVVHEVSQKPVKTNSVPYLTLEEAMKEQSSDGTLYGNYSSDILANKSIGINKGLKSNNITSEKQDELIRKLEAIKLILASRNPQATQVG